ncbi:hypothetical protein HBH44_242830 [Parastagonospora nodorum]|nr:hypothetical protein HBH44_242830 [Parastagonospora nodorum]KAH4238107.1 hypothetical protein HBI06_045010 [Parastagonospora nodorum]KAH4553454.1 hypothetical protein HBH84_246850 [Parastagonospora nodorum]KAH4611717.1 hypothetical protein HBH55_241610 [Parastagonospora nodorum]KAH4618175.1 hypothetical protein HBH81_244480 [Parastagonospora nodorum]
MLLPLNQCCGTNCLNPWIVMAKGKDRVEEFDSPAVYTKQEDTIVQAVEVVGLFQRPSTMESHNTCTMVPCIRL